LREAQAADTRRRILDAAVLVFGEQGYSGASLARIASAAGVSVETVKQHGPKAALLLAAFDQAFSGEEGEGPLHAREFGEKAAALSGRDFLPYLIDFIASANARVARLWPRVLDAGSSDAEVAKRLELLQVSRRQDMLAAVALLREKGVCHSTRPDEVLASVLSFLISPEGHTQLVTDAGWSEAAYRTWVIDAVERLVLQD
jgi:AcrR family transcriptional regulator